MPVASSPKTYDCEVCGAALQSKWALDNHMCLFHDVCGPTRPGAQITFRCAACGEAFARRVDLLEHMESSGHGGSEGRPDAVTTGRRRGRATPRGKGSGRS